MVGATATNVALWKIGKMVSDSTNHPSSGLTEALIDNAIGNSFSTSDTLALDSTKTISTLRTALSSSGLGSSPTASAVQDWVGTHVGLRPQRHSRLIWRTQIVLTLLFQIGVAVTALLKVPPAAQAAVR